MSDVALVIQLQNELNVVQQDPDIYPSGWAVALGVLRNIEFGPPSTGSNGATTGGYRVSPTQLRNWISELQVILDWTYERDRYIKVIQESQPAAPDPGSGAANRAYVNTGQALRRSNAAIKDSAAKLITAFKASLQAYQDTEQSNQDSMHGVGKGH